MEAALCLSDVNVHGANECFKMMCLRYRIEAGKQNNNRATRSKLTVAELKKVNLEINT